MDFSFLEEKKGTSFVPGINENVKLAAYSIHENSRGERNPSFTFEKEGSTVYLYINFPTPAKGATSVTPAAFKVFITKLYKLASIYADAKTLNDLLTKAATKLGVNKVEDHAFDNIKKLHEQCELYFKALTSVMGNAQNVYGKLVLGYKPNNRYLNIPNYGEGKIYEIGFYPADKDNSEIKIPSTDKFSLTPFEDSYKKEDEDTSFSVKPSTKQEDDGEGDEW